jgi:formylglycine-generating enzyme required for sulfatase activity
MKKWLGFLMCGLLCVLLFGGLPGGLAQAQNQTFTNSVGMEFVEIPAGTFMMGSKEETPAHQVTISKAFYLGKHEVTQEQWVAVMGSNPAQFKGRTNPVENVSWDGVQVFIQKLNQKEGGNKYRLPTEAEWEYAARAGTKTEWFFGDDPAALGQYAWFDNNSKDTTHPVGEKKPNPWGLYDIYGNVWEWVADGSRKYQAGAVTDPTGPADAPHLGNRGGSWGDSAKFSRSAARSIYSPELINEYLGFRLAFSPGQ